MTLPGRRRLRHPGTIQNSGGSGLFLRHPASRQSCSAKQDRAFAQAPVGRPPKRVKRVYGDFEYLAVSWDKPRRVVAKVEWYPGELFPRVGFVVTNLPMQADWIIQFYNQRGTAEQHIKEGKQAINWTRLSCKGKEQNEVRLQLHALAYNLGVFLQGTDLPEEMADWSLTSLQSRLIKTGARVVRHARAITFQLAEVAATGDLFNRILAAIHHLRSPPVAT